MRLVNNIILEGVMFVEIKIKEWKELLGRSSKDQWGNDTMIGEVTEEYIEIGTLEPGLCGGHLIRQIHLDDDANGVQCEN